MSDRTREVKRLAKMAQETIDECGTADGACEAIEHLALALIVLANALEEKEACK